VNFQTKKTQDTELNKISSCKKYSFN